jgi:hypothetical protein
MTKAAQHTSGPWVFIPAPNSDPRTRFAIRSADGIVVAIASPLPNSPDFPEREANAHILAAAPDLLKTLEAWAFADADPEAARRKGYYDRCREQRDTLLRKLGSKAVRP